MIYRKTVTVDKKIANEIEYWLHHVPKDRDDAMNDMDPPITITIHFDDGIEMDVDLCGADFDAANPRNSLPWTEAVLYDPDGSRIDYADTCDNDDDDEYFGTWATEGYDGDIYVAEVRSPFRAYS